MQVPRTLLVAAMLALAACTPDVPTGPAEPTQLTLVSAPPTGTPGWLLDAPLTVKVTDAGGRPIVGAAVDWRAQSESAQLESDRPIPESRSWTALHPGWTSNSITISDENGIARVRYAPGWESGTQRVDVSAGGAALTVSVPVTSFTATSVAFGSSRACGLDVAGRMYCWKPYWPSRDYAPTTIPALMRPVPAAGPERFVQLSGSGEWRNVDVCGITVAHQLYCAALGNTAGVVTMEPVATPVPFVAITASGIGTGPALSTFCGLDPTGQAWCRGQNNAGQLGDGTTISRTTFAPVVGSVRFSTLVVSEDRVCGVDLGGGAWCWGRGPGPDLGVADGKLITIPTAVAQGRSYREVIPVSTGVCGIRPLTNQMECWGAAMISLSGMSWPTLGQNPLDPRLVAGNPLLREVAGNAGYAGQFLTMDGRIASWGPFDNMVIADPEYGAGLTGFDHILTQGSAAICSSHVSGSTVCSWAYFRGVGVPVPAP
ncbi:MAG: hypothetical protein V4558_05535 [Gemmatimonadota bacterium]